MSQWWLALAVPLWSMAWGAAPTYSTAGIVNASNYTAGPFAPYSILTIFGTSLADPGSTPQSLSATATALPTNLNGTEVIVNGSPAPLFYVSDTQINFLLPMTLDPTLGSPTIWVTHNSNAGPVVSIALADGAPALFPNPANTSYVLAQHGADYSLITPDHPAQGGEIVVVYATGLGKVTGPFEGMASTAIPQYASPVVNLSELTVTLAGAAVDPTYIKYAGLTPGFAGLYQINVAIPYDAGKDPEIRVAMGAQSSPAGLALAVQPAQLSTSAAR